MPTAIPEYQQKVQAQDAPSVRLRVNVTPKDVVGDIPQGLDRLNAGVQDVMRTQQESRLNQAYVDLSAARFDIEDEIDKQVGQDALTGDLEGKGQKKFRQAADALAKDIPDGAVRRAFNAAFARENEGLREHAVKHVGAQSKRVEGETWKSAAEMALQKAARSAEVTPEGGVLIDVRPRQDLDALTTQRIQSRGMDPAGPIAQQLRGEVSTGYHVGIIEEVRGTSPGAALAYLERNKGEMDPDKVQNLRRELKPSSLIAEAQAKVMDIEAANPKDAEARVKAAMAVPGELGQKTLQVLREREAMAEEARADGQQKIVSGLMNGISGGAIGTVSQLEALPDFTGNLDDDGRVRVRDYLLAKQHQAAAERRARESHTEARAQARRDLEFTTWFARQPAAVRLTTNVDEEAAKRGASVVGANRAGALQQTTRTSLPKMFDQQGFAKDANGWALAAYPGTSSSAKRTREGFIAGLREWHDGEVLDGRAVDDKAMKAKAAERLTFGEEANGGAWNSNMTAEEARQKGIPFKPFPASDQKNPLVKEVLASAGPASAEPPAQPPGPVRVSTPAEARALPKGTRFITPDGKIKVRP